MAEVAPPPRPTGTRSVSIDNSGQSIGDFSTLKNLTLNGNAGQIAVPPGTYGDFAANAGSGFVLGVAGSIEPATYDFQSLSLNSNSTFTLVGPVRVTVNDGLSSGANMGEPAHPEWLRLRIAAGGFTLSGKKSIYGHLELPVGELTINGGSQLVGALASDRLSLNGNALLRLVAPVSANRPPIVSLQAPLDGSSYSAPASLILEASASDADGSVAKVEFYAGSTKLGEAAATPYRLPLGQLSAGNYTFTARAIDNLGATTDSSAVNVTVLSPNQPPTVSMASPQDGSLYTAPIALTLTANAADGDGSVVKVEFYADSTKLGEDLSQPYELTTGNLSPGTYVFGARATDNLNTVSDLAAVTITVLAPNQAPQVVITAPISGTSYAAPGTFTLKATASDIDGVVAKIEFFQGVSKVGEDFSPPFEYELSGLASGTYNFLARATDNAGSSTDSAPTTVIVVPAVSYVLPFMASFETEEGYIRGSLHGQRGWTASSSAIVTDVDAFTGLQSVLVPDHAPPHSLSRVFDLHPTNSVVFADLFILPQAAASEADSAKITLLNSADLAFVRTGTNGRFMVRHGDGLGGGIWQPSRGVLPVDAGGFTADWIRVTLRLDYANKQWDLYVGGIMVATSVGFGSAMQEGLGSFTLTGQAMAPTLLDDFFAVFDNPLFADADRDGMDDGWEAGHGLNSTFNDRDTDEDGDGLTNVTEYLLGTSPDSTDSDGDGLGDSHERALGTNPVRTDSDGDGLPDGWEQAKGLNPLDASDASLDSDGDGVSNLLEYQGGKDPNDYYNGILPDMTSLVGANGELGPEDTIQLRVTNSIGQPMVNAPVTFVVQSGGHQLAATLSGPASNEVTVRTGSDGIAKAYVRGGSN
jgi:hypothetical protein